MTTAVDPERPRKLATFTGRGYDKGGSVLKRVLWVLVGQPIQASVLCPLKVRASLLRLFGATIGPGVHIRHGVQIHWPWKLIVGRDSWIGVEAWLLNLEPITIGDDVCISQQAMLCTGSHLAADPSFEFDNAAIEIANGAWIAARATVLRGVHIGAGVVVGAGAIVTKNVPDGAKILAPRSEVRLR